MAVIVNLPKVLIYNISKYISSCLLSGHDFRPSNNLCHNYNFVQFLEAELVWVKVTDDQGNRFAETNQLLSIRKIAKWE